ncbi:MAG: NAD(P)-dependent oxidoreductase [Alphaproteobacteria bacterium]
MRTVVLFGGTGFIGRNLAAHLAAAGDSVITVSRSGAPAEGAQKNYSIAGLRDIGAIPPNSFLINVAAHRYDASNFLAGQSEIIVRNAELYGLAYQFAVEHGIKEVRSASSVAVYPAELTIMDDRAPIDLNGPPHEREAFYAWSKRWGEILAGLYRQRYGINTISLRLSNPYGPHDSTDVKNAHVLPAFVMKALSKSPEFEIMGNPDASRDFIFVRDVCLAFEKSLALSGRTEAFNLCTGTQTTLKELAETAMKLVGKTKPIKLIGDSTQGVARRISTGDLIKEELQIPRWTKFEEGLAITIDWYRHALEQ